MCVQDVDVQCVLQFTLIHAAGCALHRRTSRVIHRSKLSDKIFGCAARGDTGMILARGLRSEKEKYASWKKARAGRPESGVGLFKPRGLREELPQPGISRLNPPSTARPFSDHGSRARAGGRKLTGRRNAVPGSNEGEASCLGTPRPSSRVQTDEPGRPSSRSSGPASPPLSPRAPNIETGGRAGRVARQAQSSVHGGAR